jgi:release factor glutamine methyltransferase
MAAGSETGVLLTGTELLAWRRLQLQEGGRPADLDWLLDLGGGLPWAALQRVWLDPSAPVRLHVDLGALGRLWREHLRVHTPLQHLVGVCPWRDFTLAVSPAVLIPRQETEMLAELATALAEHLPPMSPGPLLWADLGTGSGCLALALALAFPQARGLAVDRCPLALAQAAENLEAAGLRSPVTLVQGCWWDPLRPYWGRLHLVVSNPPYIPTSELGGLEPVVRLHEPILALDGGPDGLQALRAIAQGALEALAPGGWLLLEHHHDQAAAVRDLLISAGLVEVSSRQDLEGHWRFALARRSGPATAPPPLPETALRGFRSPVLP